MDEIDAINLILILRENEEQWATFDRWARSQLSDLKTQFDSQGFV
jgi:hypothetical protein